MFKSFHFFPIKQLILVLHTALLPVFAGEEIRFETARGSEIMDYVQDVIRISDVCYSEYPYLYDGTQSDEEFYRHLYGQWPDARLIMAFDQNHAIGYAIGVPMKDILVGHEALLADGYTIDSLFLLGEIALLDSYRGQMIGTKMAQQMETIAKDEIGAVVICLSQIDEECVPTAKPENYCPIDDFWLNLGYEPRRDLRFCIDWKNIGETQVSHHTLFYWIKRLLRD